MDQTLPAPEFPLYAANLLQRWKDRARRFPDRVWAEGIIRDRPHTRGLQDEEPEVDQLIGELRSMRIVRDHLGARFLSGDAAVIARITHE